MKFRRPKIYFLQFLLIPIRIIVAVPLIVFFLLFLNALKALISLSGLLLLYGLVWLLDRFVWPGLLQMPDGIFILLVILTYIFLFYVLPRVFDSGPVPIKTEPPAAPKRGLYDVIFDFVFEAKYIEPAIEIYGRSFPEPKFEDYGLEAEQYFSYNRRFSLEGFEFTVPLLSSFIAGYVAHSRVAAPNHLYIGISVFIFMCLTMVTFEQIYARRYPQYFKVKNYNRAKKIYDSIQEQLRKERFRPKRNG